MTIEFSYEKKSVLQALRYHFLSRREIRLMIVLVNVFALCSLLLFYFKKILPLAFVVGSLLWFVLMISFWFILPALVYRRASTFRDHFQMEFTQEGFSLGNERGGRSWRWSELSKTMETPYYFYFYFNPTSFFLVPKAAFDEAGIAELRQLVKVVRKD
ncbi:MAG: YcxB family protein [Flaviaesturariibacter sp.]|nr:YcxB family protein [Flaviaesturariibacter sp.]